LAIVILPVTAEKARISRKAAKQSRKERQKKTNSRTQEFQNAKKFSLGFLAFFAILGVFA